MLYAPLTKNQAKHPIKAIRERVRHYMRGEFDELHTSALEAFGEKAQRWAEKKDASEDGMFSKHVLEKFAKHELEATRKALQLIESDGIYDVNDGNIDDIRKSYPEPREPDDWSEEADQYFTEVLDSRMLNGCINLTRELGNEEVQERRRRRWQHQAEALGRFKGTACDGIRPEHIIAMLKHDMKYLPLILDAWENKLLTPRMRDFFTTTKGIAINKKDKQTREVIGFRPLGITTTYRRLFTHELCKKACADFGPILAEANLFGCGVSSGIEVPPAYLQQLMDLEPTAAAALADCAHAFQHIDRKAILQELDKTQAVVTSNGFSMRSMPSLRSRGTVFQVAQW